MQTTKPNEPHSGAAAALSWKDALKEYQTKEQTYGESNLPPGIQEEISQDGASVRLLLDVSVAGRGGSRTRPGVYNIFNEKITSRWCSPQRRRRVRRRSSPSSPRSWRLGRCSSPSWSWVRIRVSRCRSAARPLQVFKKLKFHTSKKNPANQPKGGGPQRRGFP